METLAMAQQILLTVATPQFHISFSQYFHSLIMWSWIPSRLSMAKHNTLPSWFYNTVQLRLPNLRCPRVHVNMSFTIIKGVILPSRYLTTPKTIFIKLAMHVDIKRYNFINWVRHDQMSTTCLRWRVEMLRLTGPRILRKRRNLYVRKEPNK